MPALSSYGIMSGWMPLPERPRAKSLSPLRSLLPFLRPYRARALAALGALLVATAAMLAMPIALRRVIDVMAARDAATTNRMFIGLLAATTVLGLFGALRFYLVTWLGERVVADVRAAVYRRVVRMDPLFFETTRVGEVLSRLTTDTTLVQAISGVNLSIILRSTLSLIGALILLALTSAQLTGVILVLIPVVVVPLILIGRRVRGLSRASQDRIADTSGLAGETLNAIQTVQAFTLEELQSERYRRAVEDSFAVAVRRTRVRAVLTGLGITARVCGHHRGPVARRASGARRNDDRWAARAVLAVRRLRRHFGRRALRDVGRAAARGGRHGAARGAAGRTTRDRPAG